MSLTVEVEALRSVPLFNTAPLKTLQLLAFLSDIVTFRPGEALCRQGDDGDCAYVILAGSAEVWVHTPAGATRVSTLGPHQVVGEIAVICDVPRTAEVRASGEVRALRIGKDLMMQLLRDAPEMSLEIMRTLARRLQDTTAALSAATAEA